MCQNQEVIRLILLHSHNNLGQNCIWSAGLVMAKYLEYSDMRCRLSGKRILELGAGAGLTSMVAALLGGNVDSTEQKSCLGYLQVNPYQLFLVTCEAKH